MFRCFIENHLIQGNDRGCYALKGALDENLIQQDDLNTLISRFRLLRVTQQADTARIELIHDRLVGVVRKSRDERLAAAREQKELQLRKEAEREAQKERKRRELAEQEREREIRMRKRLVWLTSLFVTVLIVACGMGIFLYTLTESAKTQQVAAQRTSRIPGYQPSSGHRVALDSRSPVHALRRPHRRRFAGLSPASGRATTHA